MNQYELDVQEVEIAIDVPFADWANNCHGISLQIVKAGLVEGGRVVRGTALAVDSQHSWITAGDPYDPEAAIIDPTIWSCHQDIEGIWYGTLKDNLHHPHGQGNVWEAGRPPDPVGEIIPLNADLSDHARIFMNLVGPLDRTGWSVLLHSPVGGWPSKEILTAASKQQDLAVIIPIDILGNATDTNPGELYF